jgi:hypothetical protein
MERSRLRHTLKNERKSEEEENGTFRRGGGEKRRKKQWKCVLSHASTLTDETSSPAVAPNDCHEGEEVEKSAATIPVTRLSVSAVSAKKRRVMALEENSCDCAACILSSSLSSSCCCCFGSEFHAGCCCGSNHSFSQRCL